MLLKCFENSLESPFSDNEMNTCNQIMSVKWDITKG